MIVRQSIALLGLAGLVIALTSCDTKPTENTMLTTASKDAAMPGCAGRTAKFIQRAKGGGFQGGEWTMKVSAPAVCISHWRTALANSKQFDCNNKLDKLSCYSISDPNEGANVTFDSTTEATVAKWSLS